MKKRFGLNRDIVTGIVILLFSAFAYYATIDFAQPEVPWTAESFPRLVIYIMAVLGLIILVTGLFGGKGEKPGEPKDLLRVAIVVVAAVAYLFALPYVGFIPATVVLLLISLVCYTNKKWKTVILVSAVSPIAIFLIFRYLLNVRLP